MAWQYNKASHRYKNLDTGRYLSRPQMVSLRDKWIDYNQTTVRDAAAKLADGRMTLQEFEIIFRDRIKASYVDSYALGVGGRNNMTSQDFGRIGQMVRGQYQYAHLLAGQIANGELSLSMITHRVGSFMLSAAHAFFYGLAASWGLNLPFYPCDLSQSCLFNCRCEWVISETETQILAEWVREDGDSCDTCLYNEALYGERSPYTIDKPQAAAA